MKARVTLYRHAAATRFYRSTHLLVATWRLLVAAEERMLAEKLEEQRLGSHLAVSWLMFAEGM